MSDQVAVEAAVLTQRLAFDTAGADDDDIPQFLRRNTEKPIEYREPGDDLVVEVVDVQEPETVAVVDDLGTTELVDPVEDTEVVALEDEPDQRHDGHDTASKTPKGDLDNITVEDLERQQAEIQRRIQEKKEAEKKAVIEQIVNVVNTYQIPLEELVDALGGLKIKRRGVKAVQKYQDPATGQTWSGRGKEPTWIRGKKRERFLIK